MLLKLLGEFSKYEDQSSVVSLSDVGSIGRQIVEFGIPVDALGMKRHLPNPASLVRLGAILKRRKPDVIQSWMYHSDLIAGLSAKFSIRRPVIWNIRNSNLDPENKKMTKLVARTCGRLSRVLPNKIICCSDASRREHLKLGYCDDRMLVIPNGFDTDRFKPDQEARHRTRSNLDIAPNELAIGLVARYDSQKDFPSFLRAAALLRQQCEDVIFVMAGKDVQWSNVELAREIRANGVADHVRLLGRRDDIAELTCAFDIATSSSKCNEGFSNTVGEAMACAVPCVVTDVGDSKQIVGDTGLTVPPSSPQEIARAWNALIEEGRESREQRGEQARARIQHHYSLGRVAQEYRSVYQEAAAYVRH